MSRFRLLVEEAKAESVILTEEVDLEALDEGLGKMARNALLGASLAMGGMQGANALTNPDNILAHPSEITASYENGNKGYQAHSKDSYGGYSWGNEQISTNRFDQPNKPCSVFDEFLKFAGKNPKTAYIQKRLNDAGGWKAAFNADQKFVDAWNKLANTEDFQNCYNNFMRETQVLPVFNRMDQATITPMGHITDWGSKNHAVQAAIRSAIVQHGRVGAFDIMQDVIKKHNPQNPEDFVKRLYQRRMEKFPKFKSRYNSEKEDIVAYLNDDASNLDNASKSNNDVGYDKNIRNDLNNLLGKFAKK